MSRAKHASAPARQRAHSGFRATASAPTSSRRPTTPDERLHHVGVGLAGASTACRRGGWDARAARRAVGATATAAERGAQAVHREPGREARGSLDQPNERTSALKRARGEASWLVSLEALEARHRGIRRHDCLPDGDASDHQDLPNWVEGCLATTLG